VMVSLALSRFGCDGWDKGAILVAAAGNDNTSNLHYPAAYQNCMAVAATDQNDNRLTSSNYGNWVSVAAPGDNIYTTATYEGSGPGTGFYARQSGTSLAAPPVSGLAGLIRSYRGRNFTNSQIWRQIAFFADRIGGTGTYWGNGRINAARSLKYGVSPAAPSGALKGRELGTDGGDTVNVKDNEP
jgi:thermitase